MKVAYSKYKVKCSRCKKNYVVATWKTRFPQCYDCQQSQMAGEIKDAAMREMFDIPEEFYRESAFLRSIKVNYLKFGSLSEKQVNAFRDAVKKMRQAKK